MDMEKLRLKEVNLPSGTHIYASVNSAWVIFPLHSPSELRHHDHEVNLLLGWDAGGI